MMRDQEYLIPCHPLLLFQGKNILMKWKTRREDYTVARKTVPERYTSKPGA